VVVGSYMALSSSWPPCGLWASVVGEKWASGAFVAAWQNAWALHSLDQYSQHTSGGIDVKGGVPLKPLQRLPAHLLDGHPCIDKRPINRVEFVGVKVTALSDE
jgi:hypothetical protein